MSAYVKLTRDYEDYLLRLCFGSELSLATCVKTAYLDFNRTLHGISELPDKARLHNEAMAHLRGSFSELKRQLANRIDQKVFDDWHRQTCRKLVSIFPERRFFDGQAQKWVNMTLKYIYTFGDEHVGGFQPAYAQCHAPLDNVMVEQLAKYGFPALTVAWSRMDYDDYFNRQEWIRRKFAPVPPLDVEFYLWMGKKPPAFAVASHA
jgi:hypothetical protein